MPYLTEAQLARALVLADLIDPAYGPHCMQDPWPAPPARCAARGRCSVLVHRAERVVAVADNDDGLGYPPAGRRATSAHALRHAGRLLRSQTSAAIPRRGARWRRRPPDDAAAARPDPSTAATRSSACTWPSPTSSTVARDATADDAADLEAMIAAVVEALQPGSRWRALPASHPYTEGGLEVEVLAGGEWVELLECGLAHPHVLGAGGLGGHSGLAMGIGLDRAVMLRKGIGDIGCCAGRSARRGADARLDAYREVSAQPPARRDMSIAGALGLTDEDLGDRGPRRASAEQADWVEEVAVGARTPAAELPAVARERIGIGDDQENLLVRVVLRHPTPSLAKAEAKAMRDRI